MSHNRKPDAVLCGETILNISPASNNDVKNLYDLTQDVLTNVIPYLIGGYTKLDNQQVIDAVFGDLFSDCLANPNIGNKNEVLKLQDFINTKTPAILKMIEVSYDVKAFPPTITDNEGKPQYHVHSFGGQFTSRCAWAAFLNYIHLLNKFIHCSSHDICFTTETPRFGSYLTNICEKKFYYLTTTLARVGSYHTCGLCKIHFLEGLNVLRSQKFSDISNNFISLEHILYFLHESSKFKRLGPFYNPTFGWQPSDIFTCHIPSSTFYVKANKTWSDDIDIRLACVELENPNNIEQLSNNIPAHILSLCNLVTQIDTPPLSQINLKRIKDTANAVFKNINTLPTYDTDITVDKIYVTMWLFSEIFYKSEFCSNNIINKGLCKSIFNSMLSLVDYITLDQQRWGQYLCSTIQQRLTDIQTFAKTNIDLIDFGLCVEVLRIFICVINLSCAQILPPPVLSKTKKNTSVSEHKTLGTILDNCLPQPKIK
jgi:hypothetical protein